MSALLTFSRKNEHRAHVKEVNAGLPPRACDFRMPPARRQGQHRLSAQGALRSRILIHDVKERVPQICGHFYYGNKQRTCQGQNLPLCHRPLHKSLPWAIVCAYEDRADDVRQESDSDPENYSPRPLPFAPPAPPPLAQACSPASPLLWQGLTSPARASPASARRLPGADHTATGRWSSGRPPGSRARSVRTCQGLRPRRAGRVLAIMPASVLPSAGQTASALRTNPFAAQWLACTIPYRRFAPSLAAGNARLGADVGRYSFIAVDFHHLLLAGLPAHLTRFLLNNR